MIGVGGVTFIFACLVRRIRKRAGQKTVVTPPENQGTVGLDHQLTDTQYSAAEELPAGLHNSTSNLAGKEQLIYVNMFFNISNTFITK